MTTEHHRNIQAQYSPQAGARFYRAVMGDGTPVIHYGIYDDEHITMTQATENATRKLLALALQYVDNKSYSHILDIGAGPGGSAHFLAKETGAVITCIDLCEHHNQENESISQSLGIAHLIRTRTGSFEQLPAEWNGQFDLIWSQEALCHAQEKSATLRSVWHALQPRGVFVFSDILLAPNAPPQAAETFCQVNAVTQWCTAEQYLRMLESAGFSEIEHHNWTPFLQENFRRMRDKIEHSREKLMAEGVPLDMLERFANSLDTRIGWPPGTVLTWGAFSCRRPS